MLDAEKECSAEVQHSGNSRSTLSLQEAGASGNFPNFTATFSFGVCTVARLCRRVHGLWRAHGLWRVVGSSRPSVWIPVNSLWICRALLTVSWRFMHLVASWMPCFCEHARMAFGANQRPVRDRSRSPHSAKTLGQKKRFPAVPPFVHVWFTRLTAASFKTEMLELRRAMEKPEAKRARRMCQFLPADPQGSRPLSVFAKQDYGYTPKNDLAKIYRSRSAQ